MTNKSIMVVPIFLILFLLSGCGLMLTHKQSEINVDEQYQPGLLKEDLEYLFQTFDDIHPNLYLYTPKTSMDSLVFVTKNKLNHPMTAFEFWKTVSPIVTRLGDGHTSLRFPYSFRQKYLDNGGKIIPMDVWIDGDRLFVRKNYSSDSTLAMNSEIVSINNITVKSILQDLRRYRSGERIEFINKYIERMFKLLLWAQYDFRDDFNIEYTSSIDGQYYSKILNGITVDELDSFSTKKNNVNQKPTYWIFQSFPEEKTGIIDLRTFSSKKGFKKFLKATFKQIQEEELEHLIIDIRNNGGGNIYVCEVLIDYLATEPWVLLSKCELRLNKQIIAEMIPWYLRLLPLETEMKMWGKINRYTGISHIEKVKDSTGNIIYTVYTKPHKQKKNPLRFKGDTYVLINGGSYSMSVMFAAIIQDYKFGTLIGEETGGLANTYGAKYSFRLPNTNLSAGVSAARAFRPSGEITGYGVIPYFQVAQTAEDLEKDIDTVMEFTKQLIRKNAINEKKAS